MIQETMIVLRNCSRSWRRLLLHVKTRDTSYNIRFIWNLIEMAKKKKVEEVQDEVYAMDLINKLSLEDFVERYVMDG